jgi:MFS superfamily sulfate permease-like transporter
MTRLSSVKESNNELNFRATFIKDFLSSIVVFLVALPLSMGIAIASGAPPALGLITGIIGGIVVGSICGSPLLVSGPAAGLSVLVFDIINQHGIGMLGPILLLAGILQAVMGASRLGQWFRAISPAVIQGMLAGIGVLIIASQFHVLVDDSPRGTGLQNLFSIPESIYKGIVPPDGSSHHLAALVGIITIAIVLAWSYAPKKLQLIPAPLVAVLLMTIVAAVFQMPIKYVNIDGSLLSMIRTPTAESLGGLLNGSILGSALALCFIASAETLLSAAAVDRLHQGERTKYNRELFAQGIGNALCGLVGALPMTGVIVRSKTNVEAGAKTRLSAILHGVWVLVMVALAPSLLSKIPTTALAAVLVYTGFKLVSPKAVRELKPYGKAEVAIYFATLTGIVATNLLAGVLIGLGLALLKLFYKFSHLEVRLHTETASNVTTVSLNGAATFIRLPRLAAALESIPAGTKVNLEIDQLSYIDHACLDLIANWRKQHIARDGHAYVPWEDMHQRYHEREKAGQAQSRITLVKAAGD